MNVVTWSLIIMYAVAALILAICVLKDMRRSVLRAGVSLGLALASVPLAMLLAHFAVDRVAARVLAVLDFDNIEALNEAIPSLGDGVTALLHMVVASELYRIMLLVLIAVLGLASWLICRAVERKWPVTAKKSKPIGAAIGTAFGIVMIVAVLAPTAGYAAHVPEVLHIWGEYEQISHEGEEEISDEVTAAQTDARDASDTLLLKAVRTLGGDAVFRAMTSAEIDGVETDLNTELHALDALGADIAVLSAVPVDRYGDAEYDTLKSVGDVFEESVLLRVLGAEGLSSASKAWLKNETFLGISKPELDDDVEIALDAAMIVLKDSTKDTIAKDARALAPAISAALRAFNDMKSEPDAPAADESSAPADSDTATGPLSSMTVEKIDKLVEAINESAETPEAKEVLMKAGIGLVAKEMEQYFVSGDATADNTSNTTSDSSSETPDDGNKTPEGGDQAPDTGDKLPETPAYDISDEDKISQEEYDAFVEQLTELAVTGALGGDAASVLARVIAIRDEVGIAITDEACEELVKNVVEGPYVALFK